LKHPRVAYLENSMLASWLVQHIEDKNIQVFAVHSYRNMLVMMQRDRMDCLLASDAQLEVGAAGSEYFRDIFRHNLMSMPAYAWIAKKHENVKTLLEKELRHLVAKKEWKRTYFEETARCAEHVEQLCP